MPSLSSWADKDFKVDVISEYSASTTKALVILQDLWKSLVGALSNVSNVIDGNISLDDENLLLDILRERYNSAFSLCVYSVLDQLKKCSMRFRCTRKHRRGILCT